MFPGILRPALPEYTPADANTSYYSHSIYVFPAYFENFVEVALMSPSDVFDEII